LLAISGLNIALVAGTLYFLLIAGGAGQKTAAWIALVMTVLQVFIASAGIPVQRAGWMASAGFLSIILERDKNSLNLFFFAFLALLLTDPMCLSNISFQLSFLSVFALILSARFFPEHQPYGDYWMASLSVLLLTSPLVLYYFHIFSPVSLAANLLAIPLFHLSLLSALIVLFLYFLIPPAAPFAAGLASFFLAAGNHWIHFLAKFPYGYFFLTRPSLLKMVLYYAAAVLFLGLKAARRFGRKILIAAGMIWLAAGLALFWPQKLPLFEWTVLSAGKNDLAYLQAGGRHWILNAGRRFPSDQAEWILGSFLRSKGIKTVEGVVLTGLYQKNTGGLYTLKRDFLIRSVWMPPALKRPVRIKGAVQVRQPETLRGVMLYPTGQEQLCVETAVHGRKFLFASRGCEDLAERNGPYEMIALSSPDDWDAASLEKIVKKQPRIIVLNDPDSQAASFFRDRKISVFDTRTSGALSLKLWTENGSPELSSYKKGKLEIKA
jgi:competence protein ComEC